MVPVSSSRRTTSSPLVLPLTAAARPVTAAEHARLARTVPRPR
jgi:hypothetical protein